MQFKKILHNRFLERLKIVQFLFEIRNFVLFENLFEKIYCEIVRGIPFKFIVMILCLKRLKLNGICLT